MGQTLTSKGTSINSKKLPAVFRLIDYDYLKEQHPNPVILDYGAGKYTQHIRDFCASKGVKYVAYDKYHGSDEDWESCAPSLVVCSNVLNVIDDDLAMFITHTTVTNFEVPYLIKVYQGDRSGIGKETKTDCYQRNQKTSEYKWVTETIHLGLITRPEYKKYIKVNRKEK